MSTTPVTTADMNGAPSPIDLHKQGSKNGSADVDADDKPTPAPTPEAMVVADSNGTSTDEVDDVKPLNMTSASRPEVRGHNDRKRRASSDSLDVSISGHVAPPSLDRFVPGR